ncbi:hypothetical protein PO883_32190 [Massilia sp. DJPM01]|uniref:hypothetical protein n=1 Tax=Massilia sp. DJPM01 TaxID=3024404 RepID=UPI00259F64F4|nr:hypothetical protein [Massilia sp. DJPM01]MDM5181839.1 hypothetical protein [Massilia sp. DJPM01]
MISMEQAEYDTALEYVSKAAHSNPQYPFTCYKRANTHDAMGNRQAAAVAGLETCLSFPGAPDFRELATKRLATVRAV